MCYALDTSKGKEKMWAAQDKRNQARDNGLLIGNLLGDLTEQQYWSPDKKSVGNLIKLAERSEGNLDRLVGGPRALKLFLSELTDDDLLVLEKGLQDVTDKNQPVAAKARLLRAIGNDACRNQAGAILNRVALAMNDEIVRRRLPSLAESLSQLDELLTKRERDGLLTEDDEKNLANRLKQLSNDRLNLWNADRIRRLSDSDLRCLTQLGGKRGGKRDGSKEFSPRVNALLISEGLKHLWKAVDDEIVRRAEFPDLKALNSGMDALSRDEVVAKLRELRGKVDSVRSCYGALPKGMESELRALCAKAAGRLFDSNSLKITARTLPSDLVTKLSKFQEEVMLVHAVHGDFPKDVNSHFDAYVSHVLRTLSDTMNKLSGITGANPSGQKGHTLYELKKLDKAISSLTSDVMSFIDERSHEKGRAVAMQNEMRDGIREQRNVLFKQDFEGLRESLRDAISAEKHVGIAQALANLSQEIDRVRDRCYDAGVWLPCMRDVEGDIRSAFDHLHSQADTAGQGARDPFVLGDTSLNSLDDETLLLLGRCGNLTGHGLTVRDEDCKRIVLSRAGMDPDKRMVVGNLENLLSALAQESVNEQDLVERLRGLSDLGRLRERVRESEGEGGKNKLSLEEYDRRFVDDLRLAMLGRESSLKKIDPRLLDHLLNEFIMEADAPGHQQAVRDQLAMTVRQLNGIKTVLSRAVPPVGPMDSNPGAAPIRALSPDFHAAMARSYGLPAESPGASARTVFASSWAGMSFEARLNASRYLYDLHSPIAPYAQKVESFRALYGIVNRSDKARFKIEEADDKISYTLDLADRPKLEFFLSFQRVSLDRTRLAQELNRNDYWGREASGFEIRTGDEQLEADILRGKYVVGGMLLEDPDEGNVDQAAQKKQNFDRALDQLNANHEQQKRIREICNQTTSGYIGDAAATTREVDGWGVPGGGVSMSYAVSRSEDGEILVQVDVIKDIDLPNATGQVMDAATREDALEIIHDPDSSSNMSGTRHYKAQEAHLKLQVAADGRVTVEDAVFLSSKNKRTIQRRISFQEGDVSGRSRTS
ncbi:hypothetical protein ACTPOE_15995 [Castellaniella sp. WN]